MSRQSPAAYTCVCPNPHVCEGGFSMVFKQLNHDVKCEISQRALIPPGRAERRAATPHPMCAESGTGVATIVTLSIRREPPAASTDGAISYIDSLALRSACAPAPGPTDRISRRSRFTRHPNLHKNPRPAGFEIVPPALGMISSTKLATEIRGFSAAQGLNTEIWQRISSLWNRRPKGGR